MDTISLAVIMIGSSLAIALAFGATLLSAKWWKIITIKRDNKSRKIVMQLLEEHENADQEYVIPTYYIREYDQQKVLIDISIRDLDHYIIEGKLRPHIQK